MSIRKKPSQSLELVLAERRSHDLAFFGAALDRTDILAGIIAEGQRQLRQQIDNAGDTMQAVVSYAAWRADNDPYLTSGEARTARARVIDAGEQAIDTLARRGYEVTIDEMTGTIRGLRGGR